MDLDTGVQFAFPVKLAEGLADATPERLSEIEITPAGLSLHWPRLDVDLYVPALLQGVFGSKRWMAQQLGDRRGRARTDAKAAAARQMAARRTAAQARRFLKPSPLAADPVLAVSGWR